MEIIEFEFDFDYSVYKVEDNILYGKFLSAFVPPQEFEIAPFTGRLFVYKNNQNHFMLYGIDSKKYNRMIDFEFDFDTSPYMKMTFLFGKMLELIKSQEII